MIIELRSITCSLVGNDQAFKGVKLDIRYNYVGYVVTGFCALDLELFKLNIGRIL